MNSLRSFTTVFAVLALAATVSAPLSAQDAPPAPASIALDSTPVAAAVTLAMQAVNAPSFVVSSPVALRALERTDAPMAPIPRAQTSRSVAMMVVGGAALIVGSVLDGDSGRIIMVGGGVVGLIGLWNYLK